MTDAQAGWILRLAGMIDDLVSREISDADLAAAKSRLVHAIRVSLAGTRLPAVDIALRAFAGSDGDCVVIGRSDRLAAPDAAFVNGVIGHSSLQEDCGPGGLSEGSHPATYVIPAALAAAEEYGASGRRLLLGILAGYEAVSRIGAAAPVEIVARRFRPLAVMGPFGAAAAAAVVRGLVPEQIAAAMAIASNLAGGSTQGIFEGNMEPYFQAGAAARNGLLAVQLAAAGAVTSEASLEGEFGFFATYGGGAGDLTELLGVRESSGVDRVGSKRFAACLQNQETIALIVDQLPGPLAGDRVKRVTLTRPAQGTHGLNSPGVSRVPPFATMLQAQMSARFTAAAALLGHPVDDPRFFQQAFDDPAITEIAGRVELVPATDDRIRIEIDLGDDDPIVLSSAGSDVLFPSDAEIRSRFLASSGETGGDRSSEIISVVDRLETVPAVLELTRLLQAPDRR